MPTQVNVVVIVFACLAMFIFAWAIILFVVHHRRKMIANLKEIERLELEKKILIFKSASEAEERERERIARNLHDEINTKLAVHKQILEKYAWDIENSEFDIDAYNSEIENIEKIREAITACATNLVPAFLLKNGLTTTLQDHIRHINSAGKLKARFLVEKVSPEARPLGKHEELNIYRICLELVNNLLKHTSPSVLTMTVSINDSDILIAIDHNGKKISNHEVEALIEKSTGLGLKSIKARALMLGAEINYYIEDNKRAITLLVPYSPFKENKVILA